ncbi:SDR family oxidoreductase [Gluconobacter kanchanaburiensis]|uniref:Peroxisomal trans-2-enoyl-CoA reductase n=1 Tax=Gluconobacter kanchanaburiensis NBRC 103587 TaxID=1307948 RepID=A0A511B7G8_9PROT|nr:SDR family oxidoreductase [Gluconobacter kanchanaburiensis]MBF0862473.1 SDR family oxidoreductase [Gluconobacter kanchanaburiensis]GEK96405.1 hypothetical protein GKA01_16020 [Gluconobacter kanchanaburiensis NBRC 103587]
MSYVVDDPEKAARFIERTALGCLGEPEDVAAVIVFLASPEAGFVTGETVAVDGGALASNGQLSMF